MDNPIPSMEHILEYVELKFGTCDYTIGQEPHENGAVHYHGWFHFETEVDTIDPRAFDICEVHPNIINPGKGWEAYCAKHGVLITNHWEKAAGPSLEKAAAAQDVPFYYVHENLSDLG